MTLITNDIDDHTFAAKILVKRHISTKKILVKRHIFTKKILVKRHIFAKKILVKHVFYCTFALQLGDKNIISSART